MNADRRVWKVTFSDGAWVKMVGHADIFVAWEQAHFEFGEFAGMESLPETDAAVAAWNAKVAKTEHVKAAVLKHTGRKLPDTVVWISQYAFRLYASDAEGICVFSERVVTGEDELYRLGVDMYGMALVADA
ncbi:hypothetical protein [Paraburkholderia elongata]|uniref:Uncharacterized protein n=1 Tax=Paraburkholderia elongata TaxID=2675747 RepID=A0A972NSM4_9BURK|nr:hypothetical protein [Paraburkholderia elongata]NPT59058.1 hypothetical protein [Paraburkholderia elongata]